jgi:Response regulator receiver domain
LRRAVWFSESLFSLVSLYGGSIVEVSRLEMDSTERSVTSEELKLARSVSQGGPDITATAGAASKLGGYSGFHSDVAPLDVACVLPKKVDNTPRKRRRFSFGKVGVEDTVVHPGVVWERYWYAIPCAPGGSLERRLELLDEGTLQNATKLSAVSDLSNSIVTGDAQDEHLVKSAASIPMTQRVSQCVVAGAVMGTGSDSSESGTANSERDSEHVGSHPTTIFPAKSLRLPPIRIEKQPLTAEPVAAPCDSEAPVSPPRDVIVVVDDERTNLRIASKFLTAVGVDSVQFLDGAELPPALGANVIGIFLDIVMKRSDGVQVCKALRQSGVNVPVLAMTSNVTWCVLVFST